jgi:integrase
VKVHLKYLSVQRNRHGKQVTYVRMGSSKRRRKIRIREPFGTAGFMAAYEAAVAALEQPLAPGKFAAPRKGTMRWLAGRYFVSPAFGDLHIKSQGVRMSVIESCLREPAAPGSPHLVADCPLNLFGAKQVRALRDRRAAQPGAANNRMKYLSAMFGWAIENEPETVTANPVRDVQKLKYEKAGFRPWTETDLAKFEDAYPIGTKQRLALALLLFTGARRSDVVGLGPACVRDGLLRFVPRKTRRIRSEATPKPYLPELARMVAATKLQGRATFLVTDYGRPFSAAGFGNWFAEQCRRIGLDDCTAHGLRKLGAMRAAMAGASHYQLMAVYDWSQPAQAQAYINLAERARGAAAAMSFLAKRG